MNHLILAGKVVASTLDTGGKTPICRGVFSIPPLQDGKPWPVLQFVAWGMKAQDINALSGRDAILTGNLSITRQSFSQEQTVCTLNVSDLAPLPGDALNSVALVGRAGRDPDVRYFESGSVVADLSLAVNRQRRDEGADWFNLKIWGKQAQVAADYVHKGSLLSIVGAFGVEAWADRITGKERSKPVIRVNRLGLLGSRRDAESARGNDWDNEPSDEDVPF